MTMPKLAVAALFAVALFFATAPAALAVLSGSSELKFGEPGISGYPPPYGTVTITVTNDGTAANTDATATVKFSAAAGYLFVDGGMADLNVNASTFTALVTGFTSLSGFSAPTPFTYDYNANNPIDGFGDFNLQITGFDSFAHAVKDITFALTSTDGTNWLGWLDVFAANAKGLWGAAHVAVCDSAWTNGSLNGNPCTLAGGAPNTGYAATNVSEVGVLSVMGFGLVGVGTVLRRFRSRRYSPSA